MPWYPDFVSAVELARTQTRAAGRHDLPPQAGMAVHERGPDGLLAAVRSYDDVEAPFERAGSERPR
jgi:hypothetical protein